MQESPVNHEDEDLEEAFIEAQLIETIENQLAIGDPDFVQAVFNKLTLVGYEREDCLALMAQVLAHEIQGMVAADRPFDRDHYEQLLRQLPTLPEGNTPA